MYYIAISGSGSFVKTDKRQPWFYTMNFWLPSSKKARLIGLFSVCIFFVAQTWLGCRDSNPGSDGVRVRCLTAWRHPSVITDLFSFIIISHIFKFVKGLDKILFFNYYVSIAFLRRMLYNIDMVTNPQKFRQLLPPEEKYEKIIFHRKSCGRTRQYR